MVLWNVTYKIPLVCNTVCDNTLYIIMLITVTINHHYYNHPHVCINHKNVSSGLIRYDFILFMKSIYLCNNISVHICSIYISSPLSLHLLSLMLVESGTVWIMHADGTYRSRWDAPSCHCGRCHTAAPASAPYTRTSPGRLNAHSLSAGRTCHADWPGLVNRDGDKVSAERDTER